MVEAEFKSGDTGSTEVKSPKMIFPNSIRMSKSSTEGTWTRVLQPTFTRQLSKGNEISCQRGSIKAKLRQNSLRSSSYINCDTRAVLSLNIDVKIAVGQHLL